MNRVLRTLGVAVPAVAVALLVVVHHRGPTVEAASLSATEQAMPAGHTMSASEHAAHMGHMTAAEHIAHMAADGNIHANHALDEMRWAQQGGSAAAPANASLPADDMGVKDRLAQSPRKGEYVKIDVGGTPMTAWVVRPQGGGRHGVVVVIQEIFGLSDWIRGVADQLAAEGFIAVAPDLLSGHGPNGGDSQAFAGQQEVTQATLQLPATEIVARLKAAREWGLKQPNANGKSGTVGFCFGGNQSFLMAVEEPSLNAAVVYYGSAPSDAAAGGGGGRGAAPAGGAPGGGRGAAPAFAPSDRLANVKAAVLGLYGGLMQDGRIGSTVAPTEAKMKQLGKTYEPHMFDGAAHGFLRAQTGNEGANMRATQQAWPLTVGWLRKYVS